MLDRVHRGGLIGRQVGQGLHRGLQGICVLGLHISIKSRGRVIHESSRNSYTMAGSASGTCWGSPACSYLLSRRGLRSNLLRRPSRGASPCFSTPAHSLLVAGPN